MGDVRWSWSTWLSVVRDEKKEVGGERKDKSVLSAGFVVCYRCLLSLFVITLLSRFENI